MKILFYRLMNVHNSKYILINFFFKKTFDAWTYQDVIYVILLILNSQKILIW